MIPSGFHDISDTLRGGVYILRYHGRVVFIGKSKCMLSRIATHRTNNRQALPEWFPVKGYTFDEILVQYCHPDIIDSVYSSTLALYPLPRAEPTPIARRV